MLRNIPNSLNVIPGTIGAALIEGEQRLLYADVIRPRRHAELLLESVLKINRTELYLQAGQPVGSESLERFYKFLSRRETGEPVQYIVGWAPFYGRRFRVGKGVFIPRFETEVLVERVLTKIKTDHLTTAPLEILDLCCGCGVIGLTIASELPSVRATLIDESDTALEYADYNADSLDVSDRVEITRCNTFETPPVSWQRRFDYILANPPYIPINEVTGLPRDVRDGEPREALTDFGDGLKYYKHWVKSLPGIIKQNGWFFVECGDRAAGSVVKVLTKAFKDIEVTVDLNGIERVVEGRCRK